MGVVLVTDDEHLRESALSAFPESMGVVVERDSRGAWATMLDDPPEAVVVEIRTGNAGGFNLVRDMDQVGSLIDVPVLMLLERAQDEWLARTAGATRTRILPIEASDLVSETMDLIGELPLG